MKIENGTLIVDGVSVALQALATDAVVHVWRVPAEYRENGLFVAVQQPGRPLEIPACAQDQINYLGEVLLPASEAVQLQAARAARLADINAACERALAALSQTYPAGEVQSWAQQVKEAESLAADPAAVVPLLEAIATARGLTAAELADRVLQKTAAYATLSGELIGRRQAAEDLLATATTLEKVEAIAW
jgi:hypothetical protein